MLSLLPSCLYLICKPVHISLINNRGDILNIKKKLFFFILYIFFFVCPSLLVHRRIVVIVIEFVCLLRTAAVLWYLIKRYDVLSPATVQNDKSLFYTLLCGPYLFLEVWSVNRIAVSRNPSVLPHVCGETFCFHSMYARGVNQRRWPFVIFKHTCG